MSRCLGVTGEATGATFPVSSSTVRFSHSGRYVATGSSSSNLPSSTSIIAPTLVTGLVMEYTRSSESGCSSAPVSTSSSPVVCSNTT